MDYFQNRIFQNRVQSAVTFPDFQQASETCRWRVPKKPTARPSGWGPLGELVANRRDVFDD